MLTLSSRRGAVRGGEQSTLCWTQRSSRNWVNAARDTGDGMSGVVKLRQELFYLGSGTLMGAETSHQAVSPVLGSCKLAGTVGTSSPQAPVVCACVRDERSRNTPHILRYPDSTPPCLGHHPLGDTGPGRCHGSPEPFLRERAGRRFDSILPSYSSSNHSPTHPSTPTTHQTTAPQ